ncbi:MAG: acyltransferase [Novosphingobium sp.]|nr:acyltransferase [Novosphingobium sp.]
MSETAAPRHLDVLTGIRGIAAWLVVLYHIRLSLADLLPPAAIAVLAKGYLAVDLFFVLSGFVIWYNYAERIRSGGTAQIRLFLWRRFARIWPLHAAILGAFGAFALLLRATGRDASGYPFAEVPLHVALVQNWGFTSDLAWNHPAWSISTETAAYLLFPVWALAVRWDRLSRVALGAVAAALCGAVWALFAANGEAGLGNDIAGLGLWRCLAEFALGTVLCLAWQSAQGLGGGRFGFALTALGWTALGLILPIPEPLLVPAAFALGLAALLQARGWVQRALSSRAAVYLGEVSYSTYLAHFLLFIVWKLLFVDASLQLGWAGLGGFVAVLAALSAGLYHGLEKPAQRWLNRHPPRWAGAGQRLPAN